MKSSYVLKQSEHILGLENPESIANYMEANLQGETWTKIIQFVFMRIALYGVVYPNSIFCYYIYYTTDLGSEAFKLPFPFW